MNKIKILIIIAGIFILLYLLLYAFRFYSKSEVISYLEHKYNEKFVVNDYTQATKYKRVYNVSLKNDPSIEFSVYSTYYKGHWDSMIPIFYVPPGRDGLYDTYGCISWIERVTPILNKYGITNNLQDKSVCGFHTTNKDYDQIETENANYIVEDNSKIVSASKELYNLMREIKDVKPFDTLEKDNFPFDADDSAYDWNVRVKIKSVNKYVRLVVNYNHTAKEICEELAKKSNQDTSVCNE